MLTTGKLGTWDLRACGPLPYVAWTQGLKKLGALIKVPGIAWTMITSKAHLATRP